MNFIYHHLGLGDHIICNGLVRKLINENEEYNLFSKYENSESVKFMYRDLPNIKIFDINDDMKASWVLSQNNPDKVFLIGHSTVPDIIKKYNCNWDHAFYIQMDVPFGERWNSFYVERDSEGEDKLFNELNSDNSDYALIHSKDSSGTDRIDYKKIDNNLKKIFVEPRGHIFNYLKLIERAKEIHCIDSSFKHLVESVNTESILYFHKNYKARIDNPIPHTSNKNWILV